MTIDEKLDLIAAQSALILQFVTPKIMGGPLVTDGQPKPQEPKKAETAMYPGRYYGTPFDPLNGYVKDAPIIEAFSEMVFDPELGKEVVKSGFVGGSLYDWAKRDFKAFMAYFKFIHDGTPLNVTGLHPEQRAKMGLF